MGIDEKPRDNRLLQAWMFSSSAPSHVLPVRDDVLCSVAGVVGGIQIVLIGVLLLPLSPERMAHPYAIVRTIGLGIVGTLLSALIFRAWNASAETSVAGPPHYSVRATHAVGAVVIAFVIIAACRALTLGIGPSPAPLTLWATLSAAIAALVQLAPAPRTLVAVVGEPGPAAILARRLAHRSRQERMQVVATLDMRHPADLNQLDELIATGRVRTVVVTADLGEQQLRTLCTRLADSVARVRVALAKDAVPVSPFAVGSANPLASIPLADLLPPPMAGWRRIIKRSFDVACVLLLLPFLLPLLLLVAAVIRLESPGPVLFRQWRFGQGSRPVLIYKFRTMRADMGDSTGAARTLARDPRVTRVGRVLRRLSIDELPQLLNVLRGEMSLVGPRPHATHMQVEGAYYFDAVDCYRARHRMLPGITGWAQINGSRGEVDTLEKARRRVALDLWYVANWSPVLDLWIILRTVFGGFATLCAD